jgi:ribosomal-protein-serine acetyltransferase
MFHYRIDAELSLRLAEERHASEAYGLVRQNIDHLKKWMPWATADYSLDNAQHYIRENLQRFAERQGFGLDIIFQNRMAGSIGYNTINWQDKKTELGYWLGTAFQGRGLMTRACRALIDHAFAEFKLNRVEILCGVDNVRSRAIPERLGFQQEGLVRQAEWIHDHFHDLVIYGMLADEWPTGN